MKPRTPLYVNIIVLFVLLYILYYLIVQNHDFLKHIVFWGIVAVTIVAAFINHNIGSAIEEIKLKKLSEEQKAAYLAEKKIPYFKRLYLSAVKKQSAQEEKDILIDHGYDGIMELDNQLPKWWMGLFWFGVAYCVVYMVLYTFTDFAHPIKEYDAEYKSQLASIEAFEKAQPPITIETAKFSEDKVAAGKEIFQTNCVSCHSEGGKGGIGPNLTDNYWHSQDEKTLFKNVFHIVDNGVAGTAMQAWGKNGLLTGKDIEEVASYVYHINQEQPPITEKEGGAPPYGTEAHWEKQ